MATAIRRSDVRRGAGVPGVHLCPGQTFPFLRFYIVAIPLTAILAMLAVPDGVFVTPTRRGRYAPAPATTPSTRPAWIGYAAVALAFAIGLPVTAWGMSLPTYAPQEYAWVRCCTPTPPASAPQGRRAPDRGDLLTEREIAAHLDSLDLPESSVITDTVYGFAVVAASNKPTTFVVPSDPDFVGCSTTRRRTASSTCWRSHPRVEGSPTR